MLSNIVTGREGLWGRKEKQEVGEEGERTRTEQEVDTHMQTAIGKAHRVSGKGRDWDFVLR